MNIQSVGGFQSPPALSRASAGNGNELAASLQQSAAAQGPAGNTAVAPEKAVAALQASEAVDHKQLADAVSRIKEFVQPINDSIQFSLDEDSGRTVMKVIDRQTNEVIRQIPTEEALQIAKALDKLQGLLIQNKA